MLCRVIGLEIVPDHLLETRVTYARGSLLTSACPIACHVSVAGDVVDLVVEAVSQHDAYRLVHESWPFVGDLCGHVECTDSEHGHSAAQDSILHVVYAEPVLQLLPVFRMAAAVGQFPYRTSTTQ